MSSYPAYYAGGYQRSSMDAYRASPVQHRGGRGGGGGGGSSGGAAARSYGFGPGPAYSEPYYGAELYGFEHAGEHDALGLDGQPCTAHLLQAWRCWHLPLTCTPLAHTCSGPARL